MLSFYFTTIYMQFLLTIPFLIIKILRVLSLYLIFIGNLNTILINFIEFIFKYELYFLLFPMIFKVNRF